AAFFLFLGAGAMAWFSFAATPDNGTLSLASPTLTYTGGPFVVPNPTAQAGEPVCTVPMSCDDFALTVNMTGGPDPDPAKRVKISVAWPVATADFDVYVLQNGTVVATSASSADPEVIVLPAVSGTYNIRVVPFAPLGQSYTATVTLEDTPPAPPPASGDAPRYKNYPAPADLPGADAAGEPSIGVDWNINCAATTAGCENLHPNAPFPRRNTGGVAFFTANLNEFRVTFDDCASPAKNLWEDVTSPSESIQSLDPIGFVDPQTGRVFQSQLAGASSILSYSDDDGQSWTQSNGSGQPAGVDHQTVGGGAYAAAPPIPHPTYPNQVYYASQDIGTALAARSDTGGLIFGAGIPMWTLAQCGGLHGHIKVGPDGTVYVPNKSCGSGTGVAVSTDNGLTWTIKTVPGSGSGATDPSVGIGADNTVYLGYQNNDGRPHIAVSSDHGDTWHDVDVSQGVIQTAVFPEVVAGDGDRAAFGFLGTTTSGNSEDMANFRGVWHFYVATTFDRGQSYTLVKATGNDPVQIGSICVSGTTCGADRNLLDFNDLQIDREGRVLAAYADGCLAPTCNEETATTSNPPYNASRSAFASVIRQSGGPRLLAAFDPAEPKVPEPPRVDSVARTSADAVHLEWSEPDNSGSALTGYKVYRKDGAAGSYTLLATVATGCPVCKTSYDDLAAVDPKIEYFYQVSALNAQGESDRCDEFPVGAAAPAPNSCLLPGAEILNDPAGDIVVPIGVTSMPSWDVRSLSLGEPFSFGPGKIAFTLKVESLSTVPPETTWPVTFDSNGNRYEVHMSSTAGNGGTALAPVFQYGPEGGPFVAADPLSAYSSDGTITIVVPTSGIGNPQPGQTISNFLTRISATVVAVSVTPDNMPDSLAPSGSYTLIGNAACALNAAPVAALDATSPTTGDAPLTVAFSAAASSDGDGDAIVSYIFDFGDGSAPVTQTSPTISHQYVDHGVFQATVQVVDARGAESSNVAEEVIDVDLPLSSLDSIKTHGAAGAFGINLPLDGTPGIECRSGGTNNDYTIVYTFDRTLTGPAPTATRTQGTGAISSSSFGPGPNQYSVNLTGVVTNQHLAIRLDGVHDSAGANLTNVIARMDVLVGDVTANGAVNSSDVSQAKGVSGQNTTGANFRNDVTVNGNINSSDVSLIKTQSGVMFAAPGSQMKVGR
ncbi:MAG TPA: PKD domain-containing protein, partial [Chthoniobacterales bacterium]|nr:PKD domain-containing protein [Chthoniobacterales bacterium]